MRPIDADTLKKEFPKDTDWEYPVNTNEYVCEKIDLQQTIELQRAKGKWIDEGFYADGHGAHAFRCSECGGHIIEYDTDPFCKWCGADMRGEQ